MIEIRFHGTGGQGVVVAAKLLADAAAKAGYRVQSFAAYGGERRGGKVESFLRISDSEILVRSRVYEADFVVIVDSSLARDPATLSEVKEGGVLLINSPVPLDNLPPLPKNSRVCAIDANRIAGENGVLLPSGVPVINTTIIGALTALLPQIGLEHLATAIRDGGIPNPDKNIAAASAAYHQVKSAATTSATAATGAPAAFTEHYAVHREKLSPCEANCPAAEPIRETISLIQDGRFKEALANIKTENPFPGICGRVCFHPCETHCNRIEYDEGIAANTLERAAFDYAPANKVKLPAKKARTGKKVAVIGSGPAGMACAYFLALLGHKITVFEALPVPGGIPRVGIPEYRLPRSIVEQEMQQVASLGIDMKTNTRVGKDISFPDIRNEYQACFVATGAHKPLILKIPGEDSKGIIQGLDFLKSVALGNKINLGSRVAVIGGGNVAIDAARTAKRLGAKEVQLVCLESRDIMPAYADEIEAAAAEGLKILPQNMPVQIQSTGKRAAKLELECVKVTGGKRDDKGWLEWPRKIDGTNFTISANNIIIAIGGAVDSSFLPAGIEKSGPLIKVDYLGRTSLPGVYAGGDATMLRGSVVEAVGSGKRAALGIDLFLKSQDGKEVVTAVRKGDNGAISMQKYLSGDYTPQSNGVVLFTDLNTSYFVRSSRARSAQMPVSDRTASFSEVNLGFSKKAAVTESERCFQCGRCNQCENCYIFCPDVAIQFDDKTSSFTINRDVCKVCGICVTECPRNAVSWEFSS